MRRCFLSVLLQMLYLLFIIVQHWGNFFFEWLPASHHLSAPAQEPGKCLHVGNNAESELQITTRTQINQAAVRWFHKCHLDLSHECRQMSDEWEFTWTHISVSSCCKPQTFVPCWASASANLLPKGEARPWSPVHMQTTAAALIKSWMQVYWVFSPSQKWTGWTAVEEMTTMFPFLSQI